jgi:uncharacterized protein YqjF (DUF2071 family)
MFESVLAMRWDDVLFAHWRADPETVAARLPPSLSVDTFDGAAYLGVVGFEMQDIRPRGAPVGLTFPEVNLRTYVEADGKPGIYFFNLDADDPLGVFVAQKLFRLPYYRARMSVRRDGDEITLRSRRPDGRAAGFDATYSPDGDTITPEPRTLEHFLTERYRFYTADDAGRLYYGDIQHAPWSVAPATATIRENDLFTVNGFETPAEDPLCHYSPGIDVTADVLRRSKRAPAEAD